MKIGDIVNIECFFCKKKHDFRIDQIQLNWNKACGVIVKRSDCSENIYHQWVEIRA